MASATALDVPMSELVLGNSTSEQLVHFLWRPCSEAGDVTIKYPDERDQWNKVGEEQMGGGIAEVVGSCYHCERPQQTDEDE